MEWGTLQWWDKDEEDDAINRTWRWPSGPSEEQATERVVWITSIRWLQSADQKAFCFTVAWGFDRGRVVLLALHVLHIQHRTRVRTTLSSYKAQGCLCHYHLFFLYFMIMSKLSLRLSFQVLFRLPGKALASNQHIWLNHNQFSDSKEFARSLLAKVE